MTITAKFSSRCPNCTQPIDVGERVEWNHGERARHIECPPRPQVMADGSEGFTMADRRPEPQTVSVVDPGVYEKNDEIFVVKPNRQKTRLYAKRLVEIHAERATEAGERVQIEFEYAPGAVYDLTPADKMPLERAKALTIRYGRCIVCSRHLKAAQSVEQGIGPVCIKSFR